MKKEAIGILGVCLVFIFLVAFVSAGAFSDWLEGIIGFSPEEDTSLVAHYKFENSVRDSVGQNDGINKDSIIYVSDGKSGSAIKFNESSPFLDLGDTGGLNFKDKENFTISGWVRTTDSEGMILSFRNDGDENPVIDVHVGYGNEGHIGAIVRENGERGDDKSAWGWVMGGLVNDGKWHYFALVRIGTASGGIIRLYLDGSLQEENRSIKSGGAITTNERTLGAELTWDRKNATTKDQAFIKGAVDELRIYKRALSSSDITSLYNEVPPQPPQPEPTPPAPTPAVNLSCSDFNYIEGVLGKCCDDKCSKYDLSLCYTSTRACIDNDRGLNYYNASSIKYSGSYSRGGNCNSSGETRIDDGTKLDICEGKTLTEYYCDSNGGMGSKAFSCPNGCRNGACVPSSETPVCGDGKVQQGEECDDGNLNNSDGCSSKCLIEIKSQCLDSDGGVNYFMKGATNGKDAKGDNVSMTDSCKDSNILEEGFCSSEGILNKTIYKCKNGCKEGACISIIEQSICKAVLNKLSVDREIYEGFSFVGSELREGEREYWGGEAKLYGYLYENKAKDQQLFIGAVEVAGDKSIKETPWFRIFNGYEARSVDTMDDGNQIYVLHYNNRGRLNFQIIFWYNKNILVYMAIADGKFEGDVKELKDIQKFVGFLQNNEFESIMDYSNPNYKVIRSIAREFLADCASSVEESCIPRWERKVEPVICPPHGRQKVTIRDSRGCSDKVMEEEQYCSPGICAGCHIPRWVGMDTKGDNICIPYTTRFEFENSDKEILEIGKDEDEVVLICLSDDSMSLNLIAFNYSLNITGKESYVIPEDIIGEEIRFKVNRIECSDSDERKYAEVVVLSNFNAFCDIDGMIKKQKTKTVEGWAKCQNNYECDSNFCSGGECVEINDAIREVKGFKKIFIRVICRIAHIFSEDNYNGCVARYLGYK